MNNLKFSALLILLVISLIFFTGCCPNQLTPPNSDAPVDIRGTILNINPAQVNSNILGTIYVEGPLNEDTFYDKAYKNNFFNPIYQVDNHFLMTIRSNSIFSELQTDDG